MKAGLKTGVLRGGVRRRMAAWTSVVALVLGSVVAAPVTHVRATAHAAPDAQSADFLYVTNPRSNTLLAIDQGDATTSNIAVGRHANHVVVAPDGTHAYTNNILGDTVSVVDLVNEVAPVTIPVGTDPESLAVSPDGAQVWVANAGSNTVSVIDTASRTVTSTISLGAGTQPYSIAFYPDGSRVYVGNRAANSISVIATATHQVTGTIALGAGNSPGWGMAISQAGHRLYAVSDVSGKVFEISTILDKVSATIRVGQNPRSVALSVDGSRAYVSNTDSHDISVIDTGTDRVTATIPLTGSLGEVAVSPVLDRLYVTNQVLDSVETIDTTTNTAIGETAAGHEPWGIAVVNSPGQQTAIVSLGDSYISGEAGRWQGNAVPLNLGGDLWGTDRAAINCNDSGSNCDHDGTRVYGESFDNGCNRSDSAEIRSAVIDVGLRLNVACSGARTVNLLPTSAGGQYYLGEPPQIDQLRRIAQRDQVKLVVVSIGGNDLGFASVLGACVHDFVFERAADKHCHTDQGPVFEAGLTDARPKIEKVVEQVRQTMTASGYADGSYRFVLQSYPIPIPAGPDYRYQPLGISRITKGGCPMWNDDSNWARDTVVPKISAMLEDIAQNAGIDYLELKSLFAGHEVCAKSANQASKANSRSNPLLGKDAEWVRFLTQMESQGQAQESIHPNYFGQLALGACLTKVYASPADAQNHTCTNTPGEGPSMVNLGSTPWPAG
jgi:YVTN family beta-propeller protein